MEQLILIIKVISVSWFLTFIPEFIIEILNIIQKPKLIFTTPVKIITCLKCVSFWVTLFITFNFPLSCFISMICDLLNRNNIISKDVVL